MSRSRFKRGDLVWFWHAHRNRTARVDRVKGGDLVLHLHGQRVQIPATRARAYREGFDAPDDLGDLGDAVNPGEG